MNCCKSLDARSDLEAMVGPGLVSGCQGESAPCCPSFREIGRVKIAIKPTPRRRVSDSRESEKPALPHILMPRALTTSTPWSVVMYIYQVPDALLSIQSGCSISPVRSAKAGDKIRLARTDDQCNDQTIRGAPLEPRLYQSPPRGQHPATGGAPAVNSDLSLSSPTPVR